MRRTVMFMMLIAMVISVGIATAEAARYQVAYGYQPVPQYPCGQGYNCYLDPTIDSLVILGATGVVIGVIDSFSRNYHRYGYRAPRYYRHLPQRYYPAVRGYRGGGSHGVPQGGGHGHGHGGRR